jgi:hypothetical protein
MVFGYHCEIILNNTNRVVSKYYATASASVVFPEYGLPKFPISGPGLPPKHVPVQP